MIWLRRSLVLTPIVAFLAAALLLSCGGGGGGSSSSVNTNPLSVMSLAICPGSPAAPTPTPKPTQYKCATPTPVKETPQCIPVPSVTSIPATAPTANTVQFNIQETIQQSSNTRKLYQDVTANGSLSWNISPPGIVQAPLASPYPPGEFFGIGDGCACVTAQIGNVVSCPVGIAVGSGACATPFPCPTPTGGATCPGVLPTPTKTPKPRPTCTPTATP